MSAVTVRLILWGLVLVAAVYDTAAMLSGGPTITATLRTMDSETGALLRWVLLGVWIHLFAPYGRLS